MLVEAFSPIQPTMIPTRRVVVSVVLKNVYFGDSLLTTSVTSESAWSIEAVT